MLHAIVSNLIVILLPFLLIHIPFICYIYCCKLWFHCLYLGLMEKIKLEIHHGGRLQLSPTITYIGGRTTVYEDFDPDYITTTDITKYIKENGHYKYLNIWYKFQDEDFLNISTFGNDKDVNRILNILLKKDCRVIQLSVEHEVDEELEVLATTSSMEPLLLTLTPHSQIEKDIREDQSHQVEEEVPQEHTTRVGVVDVDEVDLTSCEFPDSDVEQLDLFFEKNDRRVEGDETREYGDEIVE